MYFVGTLVCTWEMNNIRAKVEMLSEEQSLLQRSGVVQHVWQPAGTVQKVAWSGPGGLIVHIKNNQVRSITNYKQYICDQKLYIGAMGIIYISTNARAFMWACKTANPQPPNPTNKQF